VVSLQNLELLEPRQALARVGDVTLYSEDLREQLQSEFHGQISHAGLTPEAIGRKAGEALEALIQEELLAQAGRQQGLKTNLTGRAAQKDVARQYVTQYLTKLPAVEEAELRKFYKNHGEKFVVPPSVQVRELFLPLQSIPNKRQKNDDKAYVLGQKLGERIRHGEPLEILAVQYTPEEQRDRAKAHEFRGAVMESEDERKVLALAPGEVLGPLRVEQGYSVFQGVAQIRSSRISFYEAREKIKKYLENQRAEEARLRLVAELQRLRPVQIFARDKTLAAVR